MTSETQLLAISSRRRWVKQFILGTAASLTGPSWFSHAVAETVSTVSSATLRIRPSDYPPLANPGGSVQLIFNEVYKPFTLNRVEAGRFVTLDSICKHAGCTVGRFKVSENRMRCPCHGSRYDIEGRVFRDVNGNSTEPAPSDLDRYDTTYDPVVDLVSITIPQIALAVKSVSVHLPGQGEGDKVRLRLIFPVTAFSVYEIGYQSGLDGSFTLIPFSQTPGGLADQTAAYPDLDGNFVVYVDSPGPRGFFVVGLRLINVP